MSRTLSPCKAAGSKTQKPYLSGTQAPFKLDQMDSWGVSRMRFYKGQVQGTVRGDEACRADEVAQQRAVAEVRLVGREARVLKSATPAGRNWSRQWRTLWDQ